ncbi:MAG: hypothetical protein E6J73_06930 [Deltaproteobacteria bacterium]|jgi:hypothetical protein|nr:MAG: hypothetical protein E6J73_06930 [Deltaproteobacteria bacterium]
MLIARFKNLSLCVLSFLIVGCAASPQITNTQRSSTEQELLVRALERAMAGLDVQKIKDKTVAVDFYGLTPDKDFAKEYFTAWLQAQRVRVAVDPKQAQLRLKVFASVLAVDQGQSFLGTPAFTVPLIGFVMPEIPLFKDIEHSGHAEIKISMTDGQTGDFVDETPPAVGKAEHNDYTLLIVIHFTRSDLEKQQWDLGPG